MTDTVIHPLPGPGMEQTFTDVSSLVPVQGPTPHKAVFLFKGCRLEAEYIEEKRKTSGRDRGWV